MERNRYCRYATQTGRALNISLASSREEEKKENTLMTLRGVSGIAPLVTETIFFLK